MLWMLGRQRTLHLISWAVRMKSVLSSLIIMFGVQAFVGCAVERPEQDNFLVDASGIGGEALARELSSNLETDLNTTQLDLPGSNKAEVYWLNGHGFKVVLMPLADDRCNPNSYRSTYKGQQFAADLVYTNSSTKSKDAVKRRFLSVLRQLDIPIEKFSECH
jgi:hypothetical protein